MSIHRILLFAGILGLSTPLSAAPELAGLKADVDAKSAEIADLRDQLTEQEAASARLQAELDELQQNTDGLEQRKAETRDALRAQFERVIADPTVDLSSAQQAYGDAFAALDAHAEDIAAKARQIAAREQRIAATREAAERAGAALADLRAGFDRARAKRLFNELNVVGDITLNHTITCERDETIADCIARGEAAARQLARERFAGQLLAAVTEADLVAQHGDGADTQPSLIDSTVSNSGFRGQGDYFVELSARLRNEASQAEACALLGLSDAQCRGEAPAAADTGPTEQDTTVAEEAAETPPEAPTEAPEDAPAATDNGQFQLTVRSNVYYDEVFIDGVAYGSTKLDVLLPPGEYDLEVRKPGHTSYQERITLSGNRTVTAELAELAE